MCIEAEAHTNRSLRDQNSHCFLSIIESMFSSNGTFVKSDFASNENHFVLYVDILDHMPQTECVSQTTHSHMLSDWFN